MNISNAPFALYSPQASSMLQSDTHFSHQSETQKPFMSNSRTRRDIAAELMKLDRLPPQEPPKSKITKSKPKPLIRWTNAPDHYFTPEQRNDPNHKDPEANPPRWVLSY